MMTSKKIIERLQKGDWCIFVSTYHEVALVLNACIDSNIKWFNDIKASDLPIEFYLDEFIGCSYGMNILTHDSEYVFSENITEWFFSEINKGDDLENLIAENEKEKMLVRAFPTQGYEYDGLGTVLQYQDEGMTLLDYFAAKAMNKLFSFDDIKLNCTASVAEFSYQMAKAMLVEREKVLKELQDEPHTD